MPKMPCHITDGPDSPEDVAGHILEDEDDAYERIRQEEIDENSKDQAS